MEDSNDKRPACAAADVTDINDDDCDTTSEGTHITFLGKETGKQWRCEDVSKDCPPNTTLLPWMT